MSMRCNMLRYLIKLTPIKTEGEPAILELDCRRIIGWMSVPPSASLVYTDIPNENRIFSVKESIEEIRKKYEEIINLYGEDDPQIVHGFPTLLDVISPD